MRRALKLCIYLVVLTTTISLTPAQQPAPEPLHFDVAAVRPADTTIRQPSGLQFTDDGLHITNFPLTALIRFAYQLGFETKIQGVPDWAASTNYTIEARVSQSDLPEYANVVHDLTQAGQVRRATILRNLLADDFKLQAHTETREGSIYAIVVAKGGPKLQQADPTQQPFILAHPRGHLTVKNATITATTAFFAQELGRPVIDKTGLTGKYTFTLSYTSDANPSTSAPTTTADAPPTLVTAVEEQLGLKLTPQKGPVETLVVDHLDHPAEN